MRFTAPLPALVPTGGDALPVCAVATPGTAGVDAAWGLPSGAEVVAERRAVTGEPLLRIERGPAGFRVWAEGHGVALVVADGSRLLAAPPTGPAWLRPRLLLAQTLPLAAALRGREVLHASAVALGDRVLALTAPSGTGKSSVALHLLAGGARFVTDDVLAVAVDGDRVLAHPGPRFANVHRHELAALPPDAAAALGPRLGESDKLHVAPTGVTSALELGAVVALERVPAGAPGDLLAEPDPTRLLLGATYLPYLTEPARLRTQLDVCAAASRAVTTVRCPIREGEQAAAVAARILAWAQV